MYVWYFIRAWLLVDWAGGCCVDDNQVRSLSLAGQGLPDHQNGGHLYLSSSSIQNIPTHKGIGKPFFRFRFWYLLFVHYSMHYLFLYKYIIACIHTLIHTSTIVDLLLCTFHGRLLPHRRVTTGCTGRCMYGGCAVLGFETHCAS